MTDVDAEALRELAAAATPGPWTWGKGGIYAGEYDEVLTTGPVECMTYCYGGSSTLDGDRYDQDAAYIAAANPTAVTALLDRLTAAEGAVERAAALAATWRGNDLGTDRLCAEELTAALEGDR